MNTSETSQNKSLRLSARQGSWSQIGDACKLVRQKVFIEEQQIPADEEWDAEDALSEHFLLLLNDRPVATARLTSQGSIGRLAVLKAVRGKGLGEKIMQRVLEHCRRSEIKRVTLNAQISALSFYLKLGFKTCGDEYMEVSIPHIPMELELASDLQEDSALTEQALLDALQSTQQIRVQGHQQLQLCIRILIQQARRSFALETPVYMNKWFDEAAINPLLALGRRHQHSKVQWLLGETRQFSRQGGALLKLHQRAPSHIDIRQSHPLYRSAQQAFMLIDERHLLWWPHHQEPRAELYTAEHREAHRLTQVFKLNWQKSETVKSLQSQSL